MKTKKLIGALLALVLLTTVVNAKTIIPLKKATAVRAAYSMNELKKNIEYDYAKADVRIIYDDRLDQLAKLLKEKNYAVALRGHADAKGSFKPNWVLSQKRADAVKDYLVSKGIAESKIVSTAFGSTVPIASNKTARGRQENRRVEIKINGSEELSSR
jgi:outer membrane protein OmpA-like peptidoglycan-associated protein